MPTEQLGSLRETFQDSLAATLSRRGVRHPLVWTLTVFALDVSADCLNLYAIAGFAANLNHGQRRLLLCRQQWRSPTNRWTFATDAVGAYLSVTPVIS